MPPHRLHVLVVIWLCPDHRRVSFLFLPGFSGLRFAVTQLDLLCSRLSLLNLLRVSAFGQPTERSHLGEFFLVLSLHLDGTG